MPVLALRPSLPAPPLGAQQLKPFALQIDAPVWRCECGAVGRLLHWKWGSIDHGWHAFCSATTCCTFGEDGGFALRRDAVAGWKVRKVRINYDLRLKQTERMAAVAALEMLDAGQRLAETGL